MPAAYHEYVFGWLKTARDAERDLSAIRDPSSVAGAAGWRQFRERLERVERTLEPQLGIYAEMLGMVTHFLRNTELNGRARAIWVRAERELLQHRPPNAPAIRPWR